MGDCWSRTFGASDAKGFKILITGMKQEERKELNKFLSGSYQIPGNNGRIEYVFKKQLENKDIRFQITDLQDLQNEKEAKFDGWIFFIDAQDVKISKKEGRERFMGILSKISHCPLLMIIQNSPIDDVETVFLFKNNQDYPKKWIIIPPNDLSNIEKEGLPWLWDRCGSVSLKK